MSLNAIQFALFSWLKIDLNQPRFSHLDTVHIDQLLQLSEQLGRAAIQSNSLARAPVADRGVVLPKLVHAAIAAILHRCVGREISHIFQLSNEPQLAAAIAAAAISWRDFAVALTCAIAATHNDAVTESRRSGDTANASRRSGDTANASRRSGDTANASRRSGDTANASRQAHHTPSIHQLPVRLELLRARAISEGALALCLYAANLGDQALGGDLNAAKLAHLLAPIVQLWPTKDARAANDLTSQIADALRPAQELLSNIFADNGAALLLLLQRVAATAQAAAKQPILAHFAPSALEYGTELAQAALKLSAQHVAKQQDAALANAHIFLDALGTVVVCWLSLDQALAAYCTPEFARLNANCRYLHGYELNKVRAAIVVLATQELLSGDCGF
jgi:hypothetical protein